MKRNIQIDGLRGFSILLIIVFHLFCRYNQIYLNSDIPIINCFGSFGVCIFFLISFYFIGSNSNKDYKYLIKRFLRLYPCYVVSILIIFIILCFFQLPGREVTFNDFIVNIIMLNGFFGIPYVDGAHWYLKTLISIIIVDYFLSKLNVNVRFICYFVLLFIIAFLKYINCDSIAVFFGGSYISIYLIGVSLYNLCTFFSKKWIILLFVSSSFCIFFFENIYLLYLMIIVPLFVLIIKNKAKIFEFKLFTFFGSISYPLYLIHQNIAYVIIYHLSRQNGNYNIVYCFFALFVVIVISSMLYYFYEKPIQKLISNIFNSK